VLGTLDEELRDLGVLEKRYAGFLGRRSDNKFAPHAGRTDDDPERVI
jgi:hypothetical protein